MGKVAEVLPEARFSFLRRGLLHFRHHFQRDFYFVLILGVAAFYYVALVSFNPFDPSSISASFPEGPVNNLGGALGSKLGALMVLYFGYGAYFLPVPFLLSAALVLAKSESALYPTRWLGWGLFFLALLTLGEFYLPELSLFNIAFPPGGITGFRLGKNLGGLLGKTGSLILIMTVGFCGAIIATRLSLLSYSLNALKNNLSPLFHREPKPETISNREKETPEASPSFNSNEPKTQDIPLFSPAPLISEDQTPDAFALQRADDDSNDDESTQAKFMAEDFEASPYSPPSISLFKKGQNALGITALQKKEFDATSALLIKTLENFGIKGEIIGFQPGPVVTVYEFQPHAGIKQAKVLSLMDDLALALKVDSIFIHPVKGKSALGIQVPNTLRETVYLGDVLEAKEFRDAPSPLTFALGKSLDGKPQCSDLTAMPHLLIAGATGSGKSVAINTLLCSVLMKSSPEDVRMVLVDPKMLELSVYEGVPHLLMPVITEPQRASLALKWAAFEMERRYKLMQSAAVRNIAGFNRFWETSTAKERQAFLERTGEDHIAKLPFIMLVIDELADLMMTAPKDVEASIQRLAQKARASGIHLVLATQRPSVDIITGVIKANLPCRIAFQVVSKHDSRTILDQIGADKLLGKGDMLFQKPGTSRIERLQGALVSDEEVIQLVSAIKTSFRSDYDSQSMAWIDDELSRSQTEGSNKLEDMAGISDDPKFEEAIELARSHGIVSASFLQRHLKIGYNRAARMVEAMEAKGMVDKADGAKPRKWLGNIA